MSRYNDLLKLPQWQRRRLEILNRDNFKCQNCDTDQVTLNVHHKEYIQGRKPWEYEDSNFQTLCETCHNLLHFPPPLIEEKPCTSFVIVNQAKEAYDKKMGELMEDLKNCRNDVEKEINVMKSIRELQLENPYGRK